jgi:hypothetical protein
MFVLDLYFSENSENAVDLFSCFLLDGPFPNKTIRIRPDRAQGFLNLKRPIHELNLKYSMPAGFYMQADFSAKGSPKHKVHLESSHRSLHHFEIRIIKAFEDKIVNTEPGFIFKGHRKEQITVTCIDITLEQLKHSRIIQLYRKDHNDKAHRFSESGKMQRWIPSEKLQAYLSDQKTIEFDSAHIDTFIRYGFDKKNATVSREKTIIYNKQKYSVVVGSEKFSAYKSTPVQVSYYRNKLYIFENKKDGICLGEALSQQPSQKPQSVIKKSQKRLKQNEVEQIAAYLQSMQMSVDMTALIACYQNGLTLNIAEAIVNENIARYDRLVAKLQEPKRAGFVRFNAFLIDCNRYHQKRLDLSYVTGGRHDV